MMIYLPSSIVRTTVQDFIGREARRDNLHLRRQWERPYISVSGRAEGPSLVFTTPM